MITTYFAPPERVEKEVLRSQIQTVCSSPIMDTLLEASAGLMVILNEARQIVALNKSFLTTLGITDPEKVLGLRLGEALNCKFAFDEPNGCGTTRYCSSCGAAIAMMTAINDNKLSERICALTTDIEGKESDVCLLVRAQPLVVSGDRLILIYAQDITHQQFWSNLEDVFFHDLNNMLCSLKCISDYAYGQLPENPLLEREKTLADRICEEVKLQGALMSHKNNEEIACLSETNLVEIRNQVFDIVQTNKFMEGRTIEEEGPTGNVSLRTDAVLVSKVLINMLLNALYATEEGGHVVFRTVVSESKVEWKVWNASVIPDNIQLRIFQKHFSTKSERGHGLGTYSMKLFGEECLGGKVAFTSSAGAGTIFTFTLPIRSA